MRSGFVAHRFVATVTLLFASAPALVSAAATGPATTPAIEQATTRWKAVSDDGARRGRRDLWMKAIDGLEKASAKAKCPAISLGLSRAGEAAEGLASVSRLRADLERAESFYVRAAEACPKDASATEAAWAEAARVATRRHAEASTVARYEANAREAARPAKVARIENGAEKAKDDPAVRPSEAGDDAKSALASATANWRSLQADPGRRKLRTSWAEVIGELEAVGRRFAPAPEAALAFVRAGHATEDLARISGRSTDLDDAVRLYLAAADRCPDATLADDALVSAAALEAGLGKVELARTHLQQAATLKGDQATVAMQRLAALVTTSGAPAVASAAPAVPKAPEETKPVVNTPVVERDPDMPEHEDAAALGALMASLDGKGEARPAPAPAPVVARPAIEPRPEMDEVLKEIRTNAIGRIEYSLSEQMGLKVRRIVVDAGHGGHDTGAIGPTGVCEKDVTLAIARTLAAELRRRGYEVVLTRDSDEFVALEERTAIANREKGDLFVSVHANAHRSRKKGGIETYSLNVTSDRYAIRLAARENASAGTGTADLPFMLADLAMRANTVDSTRLARLVQDRVVSQTAKHGKLRDLGTKQALFFVLLGAKMPAVLVETAFLSNPAEEKKLANEAFQGTVAKAIADGVDAFVERRLRLASAE